MLEAKADGLRFGASRRRVRRRMGLRPVALESQGGGLSNGGGGAAIGPPWRRQAAVEVIGQRKGLVLEVFELGLGF